MEETRKIVVKIFHHIDNDGHAAGFWCKFYFEHIKENPYRILDAYDLNDVDFEFQMVPINYGMTPDFSNITEDDIVFIVDFSFEKPEDLDDLFNITKNVYWIDHHITAINKYTNYKSKYIDENLLDVVPGIRYNGLAGCALTFIYLYLNEDENGEFHKVLKLNEEPTEEYRKYWYDLMPMANAMIACNDIHKFDIPHTKEFIKACPYLNCDTDDGYAFITNIMSAEDDYRCEAAINNYISEGDVIIRNDNEKLYPKMLEAAFEAELMEYDEDGNIIKVKNEKLANARILALNATFNFNSEVFESVKENYDVCIRFYINKKLTFTYTCYSTDKSSVKGVEIAEYYGGGGHVDAAGFSTTKLILRKKDDKNE